MDSILELFKGETLLPVSIVAVAAFLLGLVVELVVCKCFFCSKNAKNTIPANKKKLIKPDSSKFEKRHPAPADGSIEIYVGNLSYDLTEDVLRKEFEDYGKVNSARIITNRFNNRSKGFGFVHMPNKAEADAAVKALSDKEILGRKLKCNEAKNVI
jgi:RNA recognition motif-containing protein